MKNNKAITLGLAFASTLIGCVQKTAEKKMQALYMSHISTDIEYMLVKNAQGKTDTLVVDARSKKYTDEQPELTGNAGSVEFSATNHNTTVIKITTPDGTYTTDELPGKRDPENEVIPARIRAFGENKSTNGKVDSLSEKIRIFPGQSQSPKNQ